MNSKHLQHLYWRAGFGILPNDIRMLSKNSLTEIVDQLFDTSKKATPLTVDTSVFDTVNQEDYKRSRKFREELAKQSREKIKELNYAWIQRLTYPKEVLRERMTLFWANHFVCNDMNIVHIQQYNNVLRTHALGDFRSFVKAISKEASMVKYLNTKQNRKQEPNENFARELLELFTLGVGHYTEQDIKEAARAFTGYNHDFRGNFVLKQKQHDEELKTFFDKTRNFNGDEIIDLILEQKQCATFICEKIYRYFVNDTIIPSHIKEMVAVFYPTYNIETLMRYVFSTYWFYEAKNIGSKIKSPIELLVGIHKIIPVNYTDTAELLKIQRLLGQTLLRPPNVAGWKGGASWIDSNTMLVRLRLGSVLMNELRIPINEKGGFNDRFKQHYFKNNTNKSVFKTQADWEAFHKNFDNFSAETLAASLLLSPINDGTKAYLKTLNTTAKREYCIQLMSLPEYQMC
jgi:uncharacterized protein (DUF1800 family)